MVNDFFIGVYSRREHNDVTQGSPSVDDKNDFDEVMQLSSHDTQDQSYTFTMPGDDAWLVIVTENNVVIS